MLFMFSHIVFVLSFSVPVFCVFLVLFAPLVLCVGVGKMN